MDTILKAAFLVSITVITYHYLIYPVILSFININRYSLPKYFHRNYSSSDRDSTLPSIHIIIPAYNEARYIKEKILNLSIIDYPEDKFHITLVCDGSEDDTYQQARSAAALSECKHLSIDIVALQENIGKTAIINQYASTSQSDIVVLTDASAIVSINCLLILAAYFQQKDVGAVCGNYQFIPSMTTGEQAYWSYQRKIKLQESTFGSTIGLHGAFYGFRRKLFQPLPVDTINDDVILPMNIIRQGCKCLYDPRLITIELEPSCHRMNFRRRIRISSGNFQQSIRNIDLIHPNYGRFAFNFFSGKFLRPFVPIFLCFIVFSSIWLALDSFIFQAFLAAQLTAIAGSAYFLITDTQPANKVAKILFYIIAGHIAMTIGLFSYLFHSSEKRWKKIELSPVSNERSS